MSEQWISGKIITGRAMDSKGSRPAHRTCVSVPSSMMIRPVSGSNCTCGASDGRTAAASAASRDSSNSARSAAEVVVARRFFFFRRAALQQRNVQHYKLRLDGERARARERERERERGSEGASEGAREREEERERWRATHEPIDFIGLPRRLPFAITSASVIVGSICTAAIEAGAAAAAAFAPAMAFPLLGDVPAARIAVDARCARAAPFSPGETAACAPLAARLSDRSALALAAAALRPRLGI